MMGQFSAEIDTPATLPFAKAMANDLSTQATKWSIHDFFPTLAKIIGASVPTDRPIGGADQSDFFVGKQTKSNR